MTEVLTYEALKAERDALAVENAAMREALDSIRIYSSDTLSGPSDSVPDMAAWLREGVEHLHQVSTIETPATDAALAAIEARSITVALDSCSEYLDTDCVMDRLGISYADAELRSSGAMELCNALKSHAKQLREAK